MLHALLHSGLALLLSTSAFAASTATSSATSATSSEAPASAPTAVDIVVEFNACMQSCAATPRRRTDRHTCALTCELVVSTAIEALDAGQAYQADTTLTWRDACITSCETDPALTRSNRQTCLLTCDDTSEALCGTWAAPLHHGGLAPVNP